MNLSIYLYSHLSIFIYISIYLCNFIIVDFVILFRNKPFFRIHFKSFSRKNLLLRQIDQNNYDGLWGGRGGFMGVNDMSAVNPSHPPPAPLTLSPTNFRALNLTGVEEWVDFSLQSFCAKFQTCYSYF